MTTVETNLVAPIGQHTTARCRSSRPPLLGSATVHVGAPRLDADDRSAPDRRRIIAVREVVRLRNRCVQALLEALIALDLLRFAGWRGGVALGWREGIEAGGGEAGVAGEHPLR